MPGQVVEVLTRDPASAPAAPCDGAGQAYERARVAALRRYRVLDTEPEASFDDLTRLATQLLDVPTSVISLVDADRQWFKSRQGVPSLETPREYSFCELALGGPGLVVAGDTSLDSRFDRFGDQPFRAYAGAPLVTPDGYVLGTLCVFDLVPRTFTDRQLDQLAALSRQAMSQLELRRTANALLDEVAARAVAEHARAESEQRWQALVEHSPVGIAVIGADERFSYANPQALALAGAVGPGDVVGRPAAAFFPLNHQTATDVIRGLLHGREPAPTQRGALRRLDGTLVSVEVSVVPIAYRGEPALQLELRDMTAQDAAEHALCAAHDELESRQAFTNAVLDSVDLGIVACDAAGRMTVFNDAAKGWAGTDLSDHVHRVPDGVALHLLDADGQPLDNAQIPLIRALEEGAVRNQEILISPPGREPIRIMCSGRALTAADGRTMGAVVAMTDITAARAQTRALQASEMRFRTTFVNDPAGLAILTTARRAVQVNPALCRMVGATEEQLLALPDLLALGSAQNRTDFVELTQRALDHPGTTVSVERQLVLASGKELWILITFAALITPGEDPCILVQIEDIAERKRAEELLTHRVLHDDLTGLPNRVMLMDRLTRALARLVRRPQDGIVSVLFCDLDGFKAVNDQYGHAAGDYLLIEVARRLTAMMRPTDTVARLSGDEFVVLCDRLTSRHEGTRIAERVRQGLAEPVIWDGQEVRVTTSIGISYGDATVTAERLVKDADTAMYRTKRLAKGRRGRLA